MPDVALDVPAEITRSGKTNDHESTRSALSNDFPASSAGSESPTKLPQNIWAVLVEKTAELSVVNDDAGAPNGRSGFPNAFCTFSQFPRHEEG
jgi:hypothetical protein